MSTRRIAQRTVRGRCVMRKIHPHYQLWDDRGNVVFCGSQANCRKEYKKMGGSKNNIHIGYPLDGVCEECGKPIHKDIRHA